MPGKSSNTGPRAIVRSKIGGQTINPELELPTILEAEVARYKETGEASIDNAVDKWLKIYHSLVLLNAAINQLSNENNEKNRVNSPYRPPAYLHGGHLVPALTEEEAGGDTRSQSGWIYALSGIESIHTEFKKVDLKIDTIETNPTSMPKNGKSFTNKITQEIRVGSGPRQPLLQLFLEKFRELPADFTAQVCLKNCRDSGVKLIASGSEDTDWIKPHDYTQDFIEKALRLINELWGDEFDNRVSEMQRWDETTDDGEVLGSKQWLEARLKFEQLKTPIRKLYKSSSPEDIVIQLRISQITKFLYINATTFDLILHRFIDFDDDGFPYEGLEQLILDKFDNDAWRDLLRATYGAIAWQIFQWEKDAVTSVQQMLENG